jgi:ribonuclease J
MNVAERIPGGYVFVDGSGVGDIGPSVMRQREALARDGFVAVHIEVDERDGRLETEPEIITKGFIYLRDSDELLERARDRIGRTVREHTEGNLEAHIENDLSRLFYSETRRRPMIFVFASFR